MYVTENLEILGEKIPIFVSVHKNPMSNVSKCLS